jgi:hypothetical protein
MAAPHIPDLEAIWSVKNAEIKMYAIVGALISLDVRLESAYFRVFEKATQLDREMIVSIFNKIKNAAAKREMADAAMRFVLAGREELTEWIALYERMKSRSHRNLVAHNVVGKLVRHTLTPSGFGSTRSGPGPQRGIIEVMGRVILEEEPRFLVSEDQLQADFDYLFAASNVTTKNK